MSNGHPCLPCCCAVGVCCRTVEGQTKALAQLMREHGAKVSENKAAGDVTGDLYDSIAAEITHYVDLVPKGVGAAIIKGFEPYFMEMHVKHTKGVSEE